jgi:hypothetical protein
LSQAREVFSKYKAEIVMSADEDDAIVKECDKNKKSIEKDDDISNFNSDNNDDDLVETIASNNNDNSNNITNNYRFVRLRLYTESEIDDDTNNPFS